MGNLLNPDFQDFLRALWLHEVRYVLVGGYSVIMHGYSCTTGDLDCGSRNRPKTMSGWCAPSSTSGCPFLT
ncbi:hypothetical protein ACVWYF_003162 [Hymenobacter sp. UYAg731]